MEGTEPFCYGEVHAPVSVLAPVLAMTTFTSSMVAG
jgi:hypothetical protein